MPKRYGSFTVEYKISVVEWHQGNGWVVSKPPTNLALTVSVWGTGMQSTKELKQLQKERKQET